MGVVPRKFSRACIRTPLYKILATGLVHCLYDQTSRVHGLSIEMTDSGHSDVINLTLSDEDSVDVPTLCDSPLVLTDDDSAIQQAADFHEPFSEPAATSDFDVPRVKNDLECVLISDDSFSDLRYLIVIIHAIINGRELRSSRCASVGL